MNDLVFICCEEGLVVFVMIRQQSKCQRSSFHKTSFLSNEEYHLLFQSKSASVLCISQKSDISLQSGICNGTAWSKLLPIGGFFKHTFYVPCNIIKRNTKFKHFFRASTCLREMMVIKETGWRRSFKPWGDSEKEVKLSITKVQMEKDMLEKDFLCFEPIGMWTVQAGLQLNERQILYIQSRYHLFVL